jgi:hypothetical protein
MTYDFVRLDKLTGDKKKYKVVLKNKQTGREKSIKFGASGYDDFTITKNEEQKKAYLARHKSREDWTKTGVATAGFWSKHLLWSSSSIQQSLADVKRKYF